MAAETELAAVVGGPQEGNVGIVVNSMTAAALQVLVLAAGSKEREPA